MAKAISGIRKQTVTEEDKRKKGLRRDRDGSFTK